MTVVLVHGNPETPAVWDLVARRLAEAGVEEPVRLSPPGFGVPVPEGFDPTPAAYRGWLIAELERFEEPVDLVGHDWGGVHVAGVAMRRPDLLRSWVSDALGALDPATNSTTSPGFGRRPAPARPGSRNSCARAPSGGARRTWRWA